LWGTPVDLALAGDLLFVADGFRGVLVLDISTPASPLGAW
jgi:hypothetical protein